MYESYARYIYEYLKEQFPDLLERMDSIIAALSVLQITLDNILFAVVFFGFLFFAFKFVKQRWLTIC